MATTKQTQGVKRNVQKAAAQQKHSIAHVPAKTRRALGEQGPAVAPCNRTRAARPRRPGRSSTTEPGVGSSRGDRRWAGPGPLGS